MVVWGPITATGPGTRTAVMVTEAEAGSGGNKKP